MLKKTTINKVVKYKSNKPKDEFSKELRNRINNYFKEGNISPYASRGVILMGTSINSF